MEPVDNMDASESPEMDFIENNDGSVDVQGLEPVLPINEPVLPINEQEFLVNLVDVLDKQEVKDLAMELTELVEKDAESRKKRDKQYEEGLRRSGLGDDAPGGAEFEGASKVVHPVLAEACVDFSGRAIKELFPATGPVRRQQFTDVLAPEVIAKADKKVDYMNWQLVTQIPEYRPSLEQLLTQLPMGGSQFQKFWYDERFKRPKVEFVPVDEILLPFACSCFYTAPRATHRQLITKYEFADRVKSGLYRDIFTGPNGSIPDRSATAEANDKIEGREEDGYNEDGLRAILEIYTWQVIDGDPLAEGNYVPYIITIDEDTEEVLSIYRNWAEGDVLFQKLDWFVEWIFIPWRGAYGIGLPHLIGGLSAALTGALRALLDSAHINNAATMLKLKSGRVVGQNTSVNVTQVCDIEGPAGIDDVRKLAMPMPFNPPSPVLAQLMNDIYGLAKGVIATAEEKMGQVGDRTPVGTTMALIEMGSTTYAAIHARLHASQKKALEILHRINGTFLPPPDPQNPNPNAVSRDDFIGSMDVIPVSDPSIFSEAQRFAQTQAMVQMSQDQSVKWNKFALYQRALKQMRIDNPNEILPPPPKPVTADTVMENSAVMTGAQLMAAKEQDHMSHIKGHLAFLVSPLQMQNPLVPAQALMALLGHIGQHMQMLDTQVTMQMTQQLMQEAQIAGIQANPDQVMAGAVAQAQQALMQQLGPIVQQITQVQPELQKRMPQPPMPPEIQATLQIAQMENQRKTQFDQASIQSKQAEQQNNQQTEAARAQMEQQQAQFNQTMEARTVQFNQALEQQKLALETRNAEIDQRMQAQNSELTHQVELLKNQLDNETKSRTDLLKNLQDNRTKELIELNALELDKHAIKVDALNQRLDTAEEIASKEALANAELKANPPKAEGEDNG